MRLYEISADYQKLILLVEEGAFEGVDDSVIRDTIEALEGDFSDKAVHVVGMALALEAEAEAIKKAAESMLDRSKSTAGRGKYLKNYVLESMQAAGIAKIDHEWFRLSLAKCPDSVDVFDESLMPDSFLVPVTTLKVDKNAIKDALTAGIEVPGCRLVNDKKRLAIK